MDMNNTVTFLESLRPCRTGHQNHRCKFHIDYRFENRKLLSFRKQWKNIINMYKEKRMFYPEEAADCYFLLSRVQVQTPSWHSEP